MGYNRGVIVILPVRTIGSIFGCYPKDLGPTPKLAVVFIQQGLFGEIEKWTTLKY